MRFHEGMASMLLCPLPAERDDNPEATRCTFLPESKKNF